MLLQLQLYHKMSKLKNVIISSLNVKGLRGNFLYSKYLALASSVVFYCELWTKPNEVNLIKEIANFSGKDFLYKSDMDHMYKRGRPFGGQCWFYEKGFTVVENRFLSKHLSFIHLKFCDLEFVIIGVYMPFFNSKQSDESKSLFELTLTLLSTISNEFKSRNIPVLVTGDFNADFGRNNKFDIILSNFVNDHNFLILDTLNSKNSFTFKSSQINNTFYTSNIDHFIVWDSSLPLIFKDAKFKVLEDVANMSDHNAISFSFSTLFSQYDIPKVKIPEKTFLNLEKNEIKAFFDFEIDSRFNYAFENIINSNFQVSIYDQNQINHLYSTLCKTYTDSYDETIKFQNSLYPDFENNSGSEHMSKDMKRLKKALFNAYGKFKAKPSNENNKEYKNAQKSYSQMSNVKMSKKRALFEGVE